jgi:uncharacterized protein (AIM24 family)
MTMRDQLLGSMQPVLSIALEPGETIIAGWGEFAWMTDSIQMSTGTDGRWLTAAVQRSLAGSAVPLCAYTARESAGTIAFAARLPGSIMGIEVEPGREYLVHQHGYLAGTPGVEVTTGHQRPHDPADPDDVFVLRRIGGHGRAWVELAGDVTRLDLPAGASLRTHPWHLGLSDGSVAVQTSVLPGPGAGLLGKEASRFAVISGPGAVWLQSMTLLAADRARSADCPPALQGLPPSPALEGGAGSARQALAHRSESTPNRG